VRENTFSNKDKEFEKGFEVGFTLILIIYMLGSVMKLRDGSLQILNNGVTFTDKSKINRVLRIVMACVWILWGAVEVFKYFKENDLYYLAFGIVLIATSLLIVYRIVNEVKDDSIAFADIAKVSLRQYPNGMVSGKIVTSDKKVKRFMLDTGFGSVLRLIALLEGKQISVKAKLKE